MLRTRIGAACAVAASAAAGAPASSGSGAMTEGAADAVGTAGTTAVVLCTLAAGTGGAFDTGAVFSAQAHNRRAMTTV
jgi:hypothetical protein